MSKLICKKACGNEQETGVECSRCGANLVLFDYPININTEGSAVLQELNGVGPVISEGIIRHRPFKTMKELLKIDGISKEMVQEWKEYIKLK